MTSLSTPVSVLTLNVHGLRNSKKRKALFNSFKSMNIDVIALQETFLVKEDNVVIRKEWSGTFHLVPGTKHSKGLLTLFSKQISYTHNISLLSSQERLLISGININEEIIAIVNVYSPSETTDEKIQFLKDIKKNVKALQGQNDIKIDNLILLGDFNTCLDNKLDIVSGSPHPDQLVNAFNKVVNDLGVNDIYRLKHPSQKSHTWSRKITPGGRRISRRLDYVFISDPLVPFVSNVEIKSLGRSDHRAVILHTNITSFKTENTFKGPELVNSVAINYDNKIPPPGNFNRLFYWKGKTTHTHACVPSNSLGSHTCIHSPHDNTKINDTFVPICDSVIKLGHSDKNDIFISKQIPITGTKRHHRISAVGMAACGMKGVGGCNIKGLLRCALVVGRVTLTVLLYVMMFALGVTLVYVGAGCILGEGGVMAMEGIQQMLAEAAKTSQSWVLCLACEWAAQLMVMLGCLLVHQCLACLEALTAEPCGC